MASTPGLELRMAALKEEGASVRLDLSRLVFIDSSGLRTLIKSAEDAQLDGWDLEVDPKVLPQVERVIELVGVSDYLWPSGRAGHAEPGC